MSGVGARLKARREELELSLDEVAVATRIPIEHLRAIEADHLESLPRGPYATAYVRSLCEHLDVPEPEPEAPVVERPEEAVPLSTVRGLAALGVLCFVMLVATLGWRQFGPPPGPAVVAVEPPDQHVVVRARRRGQVRVEVDGKTAYDGVLRRGKEVTFDAHDRIVVEVQSTAAFGFVYNGKPVVPQGHQDHPRRLVFFDDRGGARP